MQQIYLAFVVEHALCDFKLRKCACSPSTLLCATPVSQSSTRITANRSRFILEWFDKYAAKFPFKLFDYQRQLLQEGIFNAYNQWLFGTVENLAAYDTWTKAHDEEYKNFIAFQKTRVFKMPTGQYYQDR